MKKILILISVLVLLLSIEVFAITNFSDVNSEDWYFDNLNDIVDKNIIVGYPDGTFKPNNNLKFEEFIKMIVVAVNGNNIGQVQGQEWYQIYIDKALESKYISEEQKTFIGQNIDRKTMAEILYNVLSEKKNIKSYSDGELEYLSNKLTDLNKTDVKTLTIAGLGIICGYPDGTFKPNNNLTRSETVAVISRLIDKNMRLPIEINKPKENIKLEDLLPVDLSNLYNYPTTTGKSIDEENEYYTKWGDGNNSFAEFTPKEYANFMELMHDRNYETINNNVEQYKRKLNYFLNGHKEYQGIEYKMLRSDLLSVAESQELIDYIMDNKIFIEDFLDKWVQDTINYKVQVQAEFYTDENLIYTTDKGYTAVRGILRVKYNNHNNPNNIKEELDLIKKTNQDNYKIYLDFNNIPEIEVGKWYDIALDIEIIAESTIQGLNDKAWFNYSSIYPISIKEVK